MLKSTSFIFAGLVAVFFFSFKARSQDDVDTSGISCNFLDVENKLNIISELIDSSQIDSARTLLIPAFECAQRLNSIELKARALLYMGKVEFRQVGPRDVPTKLFLESLDLFTKIDNEEGIVRCNLQLGVLNYDIRNFETSLNYFNNILKTQTKNKRILGVTHYMLALTYSELQQFEKAEQMFNQATTEVAQTDSVFHLQIQAFKGKMYSNKGNNLKAIEILEDVLVDQRKTIEEEEFAAVFAFLSTAHLKMGNYDEAILYGKKAFNTSLGKGTSTIYLREAESALSKAFFEQGKIDSAYFYLDALSSLNDSVSNHQVVQRVTEMSGQFEFEQKLRSQRAEQELKDKLAIKEMERQILIRNLLFAGLILVGIFAFIFFRQRTRISVEKERSDKLLLNILPEEIAHELKEKGKAEARNFDRVSILFSDFMGFTEASAKLSASELVQEINTCFKAFDHIMEKYGIEKIKTIGDAYMAAGGLPMPTEHSVKNTVLAALEMQNFIAKHKAQSNRAFDMRLGIHTGPVVAGIVGVKKFQYDIWGDTVNTASRMESCGEVSRVNISKETYQLIKDDPQFSFESRGKVDVKGKGELEMWFVKLK